MDSPRPTRSRLTALLLAGLATLTLTHCGRETETLPVEPPSQRPSASTASASTSPTPTGTSSSASPTLTSTTTSSSTPTATPSTGQPSTGQPGTAAAPRTTASPVVTGTTRTAGPGPTAGSTGVNVPRPPQWSPAPIPTDQDPANAGQTTRTRPPEQASFEALVVGCREASTAPAPQSAVELHVAKDGRPGIGLILTFASEQQALDYLSAMRQQLRACIGRTPVNGVPQVTELTSSPRRWLGRRDYGGGDAWSEVIVTNRSQVRMWILNDPEISSAQLESYATQLAA